MARREVIRKEKTPLKDEEQIELIYFRTAPEASKKSYDLWRDIYFDTIAGIKMSMNQRPCRILYSQRNASIAIQTTCHRFSRSLEENYEGRVHIGKVENIDYDKEWMNEWKTFEAFVIEGKSFEHEQEVRAVTLLPKPDSLETVLGKEADTS